jgi:hypothetical protein
VQNADDPTDDELLTFAESLLSGLKPHLRERALLEDAIAQHRETWLMLYTVSTGLKGTRPKVDPPS